ncbi:prephenate dehydrogenase [Chlamydiota bacterium]
MIFKKVVIVGIGLLGGSIGLIVKEKKLAQLVVGLLRRQEACEEALALGIVDRATCDIQEAFSQADFVIFATPISVMKEILVKALPYIDKKTLITDVGSVKEFIVNTFENLLNEKACFVGSHPIAGSDKSGMQFSQNSLFQNALCILTPSENTVSEVTQKITTFWESLGMHIMIMSPQDHDKMMAYVSHMPHVIAACLVNSLMRLGQDGLKECLKTAGKGWRDTTRIAGSSGRIWADILAANTDNILEGLKEFRVQVDDIIEKIEYKKRQEILDIFENANKIKRLEE